MHAYTHTHTYFCLSAARPWQEGSVRAMARRAVGGRGGDSLTDKTYTQTHIHTRT